MTRRLRAVRRDEHRRAQLPWRAPASGALPGPPAQACSRSSASGCSPASSSPPSRSAPWPSRRATPWASSSARSACDRDHGLPPQRRRPRAALAARPDRDHGRRGLAVAGAAFQGLLATAGRSVRARTASAAALGAAIAVLIPFRAVFLDWASPRPLVRGGAPVRGGGLPPGARRRAVRAPLTGLLLTANAVGSLLAAGLAMTMFLAGSNLRQIFAFLLAGSRGRAGWRLAFAAPLIAGGSLAIRGQGRGGSTGCFSARRPRPTSASTSGASARSCWRSRASSRPPRWRLPGSSASSGSWPPPGPARRGPDARRVLPLAAILGAILLVLADLGARLLGEIPVGW